MLMLLFIFLVGWFICFFWMVFIKKEDVGEAAIVAWMWPLIPCALIAMIVFKMDMKKWD